MSTGADSARDSGEAGGAGAGREGGAGDGERPRRRWKLALAGLAVALLAGIALVARSARSRPPARPAPPPVTVTVATAQARDLGVYLRGLGAVTPLATITVRSRVDGQLVRVAFTEGQLVKRGQLLAEIDPRPFQVQLGQAEGQLARDRALLENAKLDLQRYHNLIRDDAVPRQQVDTQRSLVHQYEGALKSDEAQIGSARLQLTYSRITAPITGRAGLRLVDPGNIVHATDAGGLVVLTQLEPIAVVFSVAQDNVPAVMQRIRAGTTLAVDAFDREQRRKLAAGTLLTADNQVDPATGTVKLKALFDNADGALFPNQFVNARVLLDLVRATAVPATAIQQSQRGPFVYVVADRRVSVRSVTLGVTDGDFVAVTKGLAVGDEVVVEGADRLHEGSVVAPQPRGRS